MSTPTQFASRPRDTDRKTRIHLSLFDRLKFLIAFTITFFVLVWSDMAGNPLLGFNDALIDRTRSTWWLFALAGIEIIRQVHFLISEFASPYHGFWQKYFAFVDKCRAMGIQVPIIPGLKPLTNKKQLTVIPRIFHVDLPTELIDGISRTKTDEDAEKVGEEWLVQQSLELKKAGVPVLHYYTLGKPMIIYNAVSKVF